MKDHSDRAATEKGGGRGGANEGEGHEGRIMEVAELEDAEGATDEDEEKGTESV